MSKRPISADEICVCKKKPSEKSGGFFCCVFRSWIVILVFQGNVISRCFCSNGMYGFKFFGFIGAARKLRFVFIGYLNR